MAQLIKLHDYITRYEWNVYRYPSQYIRLKQENWKNIYRDWDEQSLLDDQQPLIEPSVDDRSRMAKIKDFFSKKTKQQEMNHDENEILSIQTELELRQHFLDQLFPFQLKWATSTVTDTSVLEKNYEKDLTLKFFLQRFPDIYLIMYYPVFNIKNAPVDGEIIMISPSEIEIITLIEHEPNLSIMAGDDRNWAIERRSKAEQIMSPLIPLRRTEHMVKSILNSKQLGFPIKKTILSRTNQIIFTTEPYSTNIIGKNEYNEWFEAKRKLSAPLKNQQLKAAEALLDFCVSNYVKRPEWDEDVEPFTVGD